MLAHKLLASTYASISTSPTSIDSKSIWSELSPCNPFLWFSDVRPQLSLPTLLCRVSGSTDVRALVLITVCVASYPFFELLGFFCFHLNQRYRICFVLTKSSKIPHL